ncbi:hypothetical protein VKT23_010156 [Stygiomarasmius scandens]|uniref:Dirigent protein n=1 Tax=Marasmiellus scandens TaxID=2682957 RepID=A0ABR1JCT0_9AGAR
MKSTLSGLLLPLTLLANIISSPGYAQLTIVLFDDSPNNGSAPGDTVTDAGDSGSVGVIPIGTASDGSQTTFLYDQLDVESTEVNGVATVTSETIEGKNLFARLVCIYVNK